MLRARTLAVLVLLILIAPHAATAGTAIPPVEVHTLRLPNGLRAVMVNRGDAPVITVEVWYHVGSRNEAPGKTGFAHLLEHLMFDGTRTIGRRFSDYIVRVGGIDNAYTTTDATVYWETMPTSNLPVALWLEADRMRNLDISQAALDNERTVVEDEHRRRYENPPYGAVIPTLYENAFTVGPYRHLPIGTTDDVSHATVDAIRNFYNTYYVPNNATIVIAGKFSLGDAEQSIRKYFGPIPAGTLPATNNIPIEPPQTAGRVVSMTRDVALPAFVAAYHIPADGTPDAYPLQIASKILSAGDSGMIYHQLVYQQQLAVEAQTSAEFSEDPNLFFVFAVMNDGHTPAEGEAAIDAILERLQDNPLSPAELDKAKNQVLFDLASNRENSKDLADQLGYDSAVLDNPDLINSEAERFLAVTAGQVQAVARKYFVHSNRTLLEVNPGRNGPVTPKLSAGGH
ncbi:MAG TPA: pitrilysin family protein [Terriglobia bacterium]|nr:pitrilysin family protein [Terriglobia bacterium]